MAVKKVLEIVGLKVNMASFVNRGANPGAKKMFLQSAPAPGFLARLLGKKAPPPPAPRTTNGVLKDYEPRTTDEVLADEELWETWYLLRDAFETAVCEIQWSGVVNKAELLLQSVTEYAARVEEAFGSMKKAWRPAEMFADAVDAFCGEAIQKSEFNFDEFTQVLDAIQLDAKAPARSPAPAEEEETDMFKLADLLALIKGSSKEDKVALRAALDDGAPALTAPAAPGVTVPAGAAAVALAAVPAGAAVDKDVTCPGCTHTFKMSAADKQVAYEASLPEAIRKERAADKEKIQKLEKAALDAVFQKDAEEVCPSGHPVELEKADLQSKAGNAEQLEAAKKMYRGVKALQAAAEKVILERNGNRGKPKAGSAEEEMLNKATAVAKAKGISMKKAMDEVEESDPALFQRAYDEKKAANAAQ